MFAFQESLVFNFDKKRSKNFIGKLYVLEIITVYLIYCCNKIDMDSLQVFLD